jgi:predicted acetyltransferase
MRLVHRGTSGPLPTSSFSLVGDDSDVLGHAQLRHRPSCATDLPPTAANHVYLEVSPAHRGKGHGRVLLGLVLIEARRIGLEHVRLTVEDSNFASRRIVEAHGGVLVGRFTESDGAAVGLYEVRLGG